MKLRYKIWLEDDNKVFGEGPYDLLRRVEKLGSLNKAAKEIKMSYSQAWELINMLENRLGFKLLEKKAGGKNGGGSLLTKEADDLMTKYGKFREEAVTAMNKAFNKYF
jgi:molybdate transport system regulatory protein